MREAFSILRTGALRACLAAALSVVLAVPLAYSQAVQFNVQRFEVSGENPLTDEQTQAALAPYTGELKGLDGLQEAAKALEQALLDAGYQFHRVRLPPQTIREGRVRLNVAAYRIGEVSVTGNQHHSEANILRGLSSIVVGGVPDTRDLGHQLELVNRNPSKDVKVRFRDRHTDDEISAEVRVKDKSPLEYITWFNNSGTQDSKDTRLGVGVRHSNLWDRDHEVSATYTTSPESVSDVQQYGLLYDIPLYSWRSVVSLLALYSDVDSGQVAGSFDVSGKGTIFGGRITRLLPKKGNFSHELSLAIADKKFDDETKFIGDAFGVARPDVRSRPLSLTYRGTWKGVWGTAGLYAQPLVNLRTGPDNNKSTYRQNRFDADNDWWAVRYGANLEYPVSNWLVRARLEAQYADEPLISGEQFGLGGMRSIRGFEEREATGDRGYRGNFELWTPKTFLSLRFLGFLDVGSLKRENSLPGEIDDEDISSTGLGVRWSWRELVYLQMDYGYVLHGFSSQAPNGATHAGETKLHFNVSARF